MAWKTLTSELSAIPGCEAVRLAVAERENDQWQESVITDMGIDRASSQVAGIDEAKRAAIRRGMKARAESNPLTAEEVTAKTEEYFQVLQWYEVQSSN
jgi:hypothetical protein